MTQLSEELSFEGVTSDPYTRAFTCEALSPEERSAALSPYRSLQATRLKLTGTANWDPLPRGFPLLDFREPDSLELAFVPEPGPLDVPLCPKECPDELLKVAKLWDSRCSPAAAQLRTNTPTP